MPEKSKFPGGQIACAVQQADAGLPVADICRKLGISEATFLRRKQTYGDRGTAGVRRLRQLEEESKRLKRLVADLSLDRKILQEVLAEKL
jgi:putative transposase